MKNLFTLLLIALCIGVAILKGTTLSEAIPPEEKLVATVPDSSAVPHIGRIQVLNGCGAGGSAHLVAEYLRKNNFDVKNIGNADNWNYPETLVIARTGDTTIATRIAKALHTGNLVMIRTGEETQYDATVIVGPDYRERMQ
ncbi:MAG: LytR C-terminal domain-containing protein [Chitinispirillaceae bacterium]|nr:LytR C-terminal domain-containing protein [Chitinispirillaceae bacterium]